MLFLQQDCDATFDRNIKRSLSLKYHMDKDISYLTWNGIESLERPIICQSFTEETDYSSGVLKSETVMLDRKIDVKIHHYNNQSSYTYNSDLPTQTEIQQSNF